MWQKSSRMSNMVVNWENISTYNRIKNWNRYLSHMCLNLKVKKVRRFRLLWNSGSYHSIFTSECFDQENIVCHYLETFLIDYVKLGLFLLNFSYNACYIIGKGWWVNTDGFASWSWSSIPSTRLVFISFLYNLLGVWVDINISPSESLPPPPPPPVQCYGVTRGCWNLLDNFKLQANNEGHK